MSPCLFVEGAPSHPHGPHWHRWVYSVLFFLPALLLSVLLVLITLGMVAVLGVCKWFMTREQMAYWR